MRPRRRHPEHYAALWLLLLALATAEAARGRTARPPRGRRAHGVPPFVTVQDVLLAR